MTRLVLASLADPDAHTIGTLSCPNARVAWTLAWRFVREHYWHHAAINLGDRVILLGRADDGVGAPFAEVT